mmetsp:Transcript_16641/g.37403  ORF Transcript_16641/g.37403 Transcript_16641/m.37403 type:complete len:106 (+) Transcript_16641:77-394(+)
MPLQMPTPSPHFGPSSKLRVLVNLRVKPNLPRTSLEKPPSFPHIGAAQHFFHRGIGRLDSFSHESGFSATPTNPMPEQIRPTEQPPVRPRFLSLPMQWRPVAPSL